MDIFIEGLLTAIELAFRYLKGVFTEGHYTMGCYIIAIWVLTLFGHFMCDVTNTKGKQSRPWKCILMSIVVPVAQVFLMYKLNELHTLEMGISLLDGISAYNNSVIESCEEMWLHAVVSIELIIVVCIPTLYNLMLFICNIVNTIDDKAKAGKKSAEAEGKKAKAVEK